MARGRTAEELKKLRRKYKLGEFRISGPRGQALRNRRRKGHRHIVHYTTQREKDYYKFIGEPELGL